MPVDEAEAEHRRFIIDRCRIAVQVTPTPPPLYSHFSTCRPSLFAVSWAPGPQDTMYVQLCASRQQTC